MTITDAKAEFSLIAGVTPTRTNSTNNVQVGLTTTPVSWTDADIAYSFKVAGDDTEVATLTLSSGAVADTTGTPTQTDNDVDFEGKALPTMVTAYAVLVECTATPATSIAVGGTFGLAGTLQAVGDRVLLAHVSGDTTLGTVTFTYTGASGEIECTVIGKTT